jgi:hypothetical protein
MSVPFVASLKRNWCCYGEVIGDAKVMLRRLASEALTDGGSLCLFFLIRLDSNFGLLFTKIF